MTWQPIDTAPKDGTWAMLFCPDLDRNFGGPNVTFGFFHKYKYGKISYGGEPAQNGHWHEDLGEDKSPLRPSHWMPLPEPPSTSPEGTATQ